LFPERDYRTKVSAAPTLQIPIRTTTALVLPIGT
jgi:hypothetical protein